jgi:hypothetical protein
MDTFTATALARAERDAERRLTERAEEIVLEASHRVAISPGPIALEDRLALAYGSPVPKAMSDYFVHWNLPASRDPWGVQQRSAGREIARLCDLASKAAENRCKESAARLAQLEARLADIESRHSSVCAALKSDPAPMADPLEIGQQSAIKEGCERLLPILRQAIEAARPEPERATREAANWGVLYRLGETVAGAMTGAGLARDLGYEFDWQVCSPANRRKREEERREEAERKRAEAEIWRAEDRKRWDEKASDEQAKQAAIAEIDSLDFAGLISYLFFQNQKLALAEVKARVAGSDELRTFKEAVRLWPGANDPDLLIAAQRDVNDWIERRRLHPTWRPNTEDELISRAARRLAQLLRPGAAAALSQASQGQPEIHEPTRGEIDRMDFDSLLGFIFAGKTKALDSMPTLKAVIAARPDRPASNTLEAAKNELLAIGATESFLYNHALRRLAALITSQEETQSL